MGKVLSPNTEKVLRDRYYLRTPQGEYLETEWEQACRRVADCVARGHLPSPKTSVLDAVNDARFPEMESWADHFFNVLYPQLFLANSPTWFNAGNPYTRSMLSACFILFVPDDIPGIFKAVQDGAIIGKSGGGIGGDFSAIRPKDDVTNSGGKASGAISFMGPFQAMGEAIIQGGKRRIAKMGMLSVWHPEILMFIDLKRQTGPERAALLVERYGLSLAQARQVLMDTNWLQVKNLGTDQEQDIWHTPFDGFNISVKITDEFMRAKDNDELFMLRKMIIPEGESNPRARSYELEPWRGPVYDPRNTLPGNTIGENLDGLVVEKEGIKYVKARQLWYERLMPAAHKSAEPGVVFDDTINRDNPVKSMGWIRNSNPCGEYNQVPYNSCNLGSIAVSRYFIGLHSADYTPARDWSSQIDWTKLAADARTSQRFLDYVITMNDYPLPEITEVTNLTRPTGLGVMAFADLLIDLQVAYGSPLSVRIADKVMQWVQYHAWLESAQLAKECGPFPELKNNRAYFDEKMARLSEEIVSHPAYDSDTVPNLNGMYKMHGVRNCHVTVIAPTGTISLMAECSNGIEPTFSFATKRQDTVGVRWYYDERAFTWLQERYYDGAPLDVRTNQDDLAGWLLEHHRKDLPLYFKDASQVTPEEHIAVQAAFQRYCDNAISKTCNMPAESTVEDVARVYDLAYTSGLKGCTVYRQGSREGVLIDMFSKPKEKEKEKEKELAPTQSVAKVLDRPAFLEGGTYVVPDGKNGKLYVTINYEPQWGKIFEVFLRENTSNEWTELAGRIISLLLRSNVPISEIRQQLKRVDGQSTIFHNGKRFNSPVQLLDEVIFEEAGPYFASRVKGLAAAEIDTDFVDHSPVEQPKCPDCGHELRREGGCTTCSNKACGYSECK